MSSYTVLTVFENTDTINEPVISLPLMGRMSFRQIGIIIGLAVMLPMMIYSMGSEQILDIFPDPAFTFVAVQSEIRITWDVMFALIPIPAGLALGVPRPKLVPMDRLVILLLGFAMHHTSIQHAKKSRKNPTKKSSLAGFAQKGEIASSKQASGGVYSVAVTELGMPKNITITVYDTRGNLMRHRLARAYVDDELLCSITTDSDGVIGMTFIPKREGTHSLRIMVDGIKDPIVNATLEVKRH